MSPLVAAGASVTSRDENEEHSQSLAVLHGEIWSGVTDCTHWKAATGLGGIEQLLWQRPIRQAGQPWPKLKRQGAHLGASLRRCPILLLDDAGEGGEVHQVRPS